MKLANSISAWCCIDLVLLGIVVVLISTSCAMWDGGVLNTEIRTTADNHLSCVITNVPCLVNTNGNTIMHLTDDQWALFTKLLARDSNSAWRVESKTIQVQLQKRK